MFKFILALLALLALSINVSAVAEITSLDSFNNGTSLVVRQGLGQPEDDGIISAAEYTPCQIPGNNGFMKKCYCFLDLENLWGIDRAYLVTAIDQACEYFTGGIGEPVSVYGQGEGMRKSYSFVYTYEPTGDTEEGRIVIAISIDKSDPACGFAPRALGRDECWEALRTPLDGCNVERENRKDGGVYLNECLWFVTDPAPTNSQPYEFDGLDCLDCGGDIGSMDEADMEVSVTAE